MLAAGKWEFGKRIYMMGTAKCPETGHLADIYTFAELKWKKNLYIVVTLRGLPAPGVPELSLRI
jgi:hypothetical protein